ncbi:agarase [Gilvimarinus agarilyticus]|nr:agarase [Gilvimarinus agarilyticus]
MFVDPASRLHIGDSTTFEREKFITLHASHTENDWWLGINDESVGGSALMPEFVETYDVYFGRDTGGMAWQLSQIAEDPARPGYANPADAAQIGGEATGWYDFRTDERGQQMRAQEHRNSQMVVAAQQHPFWPDGTLTGQGWTFSQTDTADAPFGTATGDYMGLFLTHYFRQSEGEPGQPKPKYVEVMNEPLYDLVTAADTPEDPAKIFEFHNAVADAVRELNPDVLLGGYTAAFPDFEKDNFQRWEERDKLFMDITGENMDFISLHFYDFPIFPGGANGALVQRYRKGSNLEATFDMLNQYSAMTEGEVKPLMISEYSAQTHALTNGPWVPYRDWLILKSTNAMMMQFMQRADQIEMAIPFYTVKAEWGREGSVPYTWRLMRQKKEAEGETGDEWVYTGLIEFFELWKDVKGERLYSASSDSDLLVDAYVDGDTHHVVLTNLDFDEHAFNLSLPENSTASNITVKHLYLDDNSDTQNQRQPVVETTSLANLDSNITLAPEASMVISYNLAENETSYTIEKHFVYADRYKQAINSGENIVFEFNNVNPPENGKLTLRLSMGRDHGLSLTPTVSFNGQNLAVPSDVRGDDQYLNGKGRQTFFGTLEIPVATDLLETNNQLTLNFSDSGGYVSSAVLELYESEQPLTMF